MFIGREYEIKLLRDKRNSNRAQLIAVYGRRRVGKTELIEKAYEKEIIWKFEGIEGMGTQNQIKNFISTLSHYSDDRELLEKDITTWQEALLLLSKKIENKTIVVFFDEFQWMASMRRELVSIFKWAWDNYFSKNPACTFVICGSISSFIVKKVLHSRALYGRVDLEINLLPFSVQETMRFFENNRTRDEVLEIYMTLGGIPQYLLELDPKKSLVQNLDILAFHPYGYFFTEYQKLFISHFSRNKNYEKILKLLSGTYVQSIDEVAKKIKLKSGGTFTELLDDLEFAGFIERFHPIDKKEGSKIIKIKIHDEFLHFYFSFVDKNKHYIEEGSIKSYEILTSNQFKQWRGYAFERFCRKNTRLIAKTLEFSGIRYEHGSWFRKDLPEITQIDLVFKRADNVLTVCEIKYVDTLSNNLTTEFERKVEILHNYFSCSIQKVLILGKKITVPKKIERFFDIILFADDIF